ncbi:hypothetical protein AVEN_115371-1 [Araneus ventricosus]|uniref:Uncharacterized protein n=1 Tax=Araneus ventricosus TaxID=182803 RepID=A0A4Y1ZY75_ARAVE|nr:hypothetical protein AVEN_115371-1 [Araneus ventricosus]
MVRESTSTTGNAAQRAQAHEETTLTSFFTLCAQDEFSRSLLQNEVPKYYTRNNGYKTCPTSKSRAGCTGRSRNKIQRCSLAGAHCPYNP